MATLPNAEFITINTGNILSLNEIIAKPTQSATEELVESIKLTMDNIQTHTDGTQCQLARANDDLKDKLTQSSRDELKIGVKLFLNDEDLSAVKVAVLNVFETLKTNALDNLILSYSDHTKTEHIQRVWTFLESFVDNGDYVVRQLGIADLDEQEFLKFYAWATVKPTIMQINLATCCVVPPSLQEFCNGNGVQLLTHSDPVDILPLDSLGAIFKAKDVVVMYVVRFLVHIKCRGVLSSKGYMVGLGPGGGKGDV